MDSTIIPHKKIFDSTYEWFPKHLKRIFLYDIIEISPQNTHSTIYFTGPDELLSFIANIFLSHSLTDPLIGVAASLGKTVLS